MAYIAPEANQQHLATGVADQTWTGVLQQEGIMTDETDDLRMAIVRQAADDYIRAKKLLKIQPDNCLAQRTVQEVRKFIRGKWYATICDINPDFLLRALDAKGDAP
ncbi:MAG TPA: hypothetical protein PLS01_07100 [Clostridia bacterium]|nr:hypothetical protein [Clostridia bacterium]